MKKKMNLTEATIKALYGQLKEEQDDVEGIVDGVLVVTDPEIDSEEYEELINKAEDIIEDTPEGEIPFMDDYIGEYVQLCPICGSQFVEDHILEPGETCPICLDTPESFVMIGQLSEEDDELMDEEDIDTDLEEPTDEEEPVEDKEKEPIEASEEVKESENKLEESETKEPVNESKEEKEIIEEECTQTSSIEGPTSTFKPEKEEKEESKEIKTEVEKKIDTRVLKLDDGVEVEIEVDVTPGFEKEIKQIWYTDYDGTSGFGYDIKTDSFVGFDNPNGSFLTPIEDKQIKDEIHKILNEKKEEGLFNKEYVVYGIIGGSQGYIGNDIEKGEDNLCKNVKDAKKFTSTKEAEELVKKLEKDFNANEVSVIPLNKAQKINKKESLEQNEEDGWGEEIEDILEPCFEQVESMAYEIRNCVRGSYAGFGNTVEELIEAVDEIQKMFEEASTELDNMKEQLQENKKVKTESETKEPVKKESRKLNGFASKLIK